MLLPPMTDYHDLCATYKPADEDQVFNFADVIDQHATDPDRMALIWENVAGQERRLTFREIADASKRMARVLQAQGVVKGDRVIVMLPRIPEWQMVMVALLRLGAVPVPCLTMLLPKDIEYRINKVRPKAIVTTDDNTSKFAGLTAPEIGLFSIHYGGGTRAEGWADLLDRASGEAAEFENVAMHPGDTGILNFTSGSSGMPKAVQHTANFAAGMRELTAYWFDLNEQNPNDLIYGTADTGWALTIASSFVSPWLAGVCTLTYDGPFDAGMRLRLIEKHGVTVLVAGASEYRWMLGEDVEGFDLSKLRLCTTAGETLDGATAEAWKGRSGCALMEAYGQTEVSMVVSNFQSIRVRPGSMGLPIPGKPVQIVSEETYEPAAVGELGHIALKRPYVGAFLGYWEDPEKTDAAMCTSASGETWYITGDLARKDEDGYYWYEGRADDVINTAGYRVGPSEVEGVIMTHEAVLECAAVASPDPERGVVVKAFITLHDGYAPTPELASEIQNYVKSQTAPYKYPRKVEFRSELPKGPTGKIQRRELREEELCQAR